MITSIEIENLRGIAHGKLEGLTKLTVLIGPNGSGKSSILDAIWIFTSSQPGLVMQSTMERHSGTGNNRKWFLYKGNKTNKMNIRGDILVDDIKTERNIGFEYNLQQDNVAGVILDNGNVVGHVNPGFNKPIKNNPIMDVKMIGKFSGLSQPNIHDLFSEMDIVGRQNEAVEIIQKIMPNIKDVKILTENGSPFLFVSYPDYSVPVAISGDGVYSLIQLGLELALRSGGIALLEEPEIHLHPAAIRETAKVIWGAVRRGVQVILTTHSIELIDDLLEFSSEEEIDKLSVFRVKLDDGVLKSSRISGADVEFARHQIGDDLR